jgi:hypothetical protein
MWEESLSSSFPLNLHVFFQCEAREEECMYLCVQSSTWYGFALETIATEVNLWLCGLCEMYAQQEVLVKKPHALKECEGGQLVESAEQPSPVSVLDNTHFQEHEFTPNLELAEANCVSSFHGEHTIIPILS